MYFDRCTYKNCNAPVMVTGDYGMTGKLCAFHHYKWLDAKEEEDAKKAQDARNERYQRDIEEKEAKEAWERIKYSISILTFQNFLNTSRYNSYHYLAINKIQEIKFGKK